MKYIKTFESLKTPEVGDYVICTDLTSVPEYVLEFIENNIGQIVEIEMPTSWQLSSREENPYCVYFENAPYNKTPNYFPKHKEFLSCRWFNLREIKYISKNKEELKYIINAKKFNI